MGASTRRSSRPTRSACAPRRTATPSTCCCARSRCRRAVIPLAGLDAVEAFFASPAGAAPSTAGASSTTRASAPTGPLPQVCVSACAPRTPIATGPGSCRSTRSSSTCRPRRLARGGRPAGRSRAAVRWRPTKETTDLGWLYNRGFADPDGHRFEAVHLDMAATATPPAWAPPPERLARSGPGRWLSQRPRPEPPGNPGCQAVGIPIPRRRDLIPDLLAPDTVAAGADVFPMQQR